MALSRDELNLLINKLRDRYDKNADKFGGKWFNIEAFEERLDMAVKNSMNLEGFILAEISNFEKITEKVKKSKNRKSFSEEVDKIIEANLARIKKYPEIKFHPLAGIEISHLYGALIEMERFYFSSMRILFDTPELKKKTMEFEDALSFLAMPRGKLPAKRIEDHILIITRLGVHEIDIEKDRNNYLKESAFLLHEIIDFCDKILVSKNTKLELPFRMDRLYLEDQRKKKIVDLFKGQTGYGVVLKVKEYAAAIIDDFRLAAFKKA